MNQKSKSLLMSVIKRHGLTTKYEKEIEAIGNIKKDQFFAWTEDIYAISRVIPNVNSDSLRAKLEIANLEWVSVVVEYNLCCNLEPYIGKYGKLRTTNAISYLIMNNIWDSPVGDKALKAKQTSNYDGLKAIDEAVEYLKQQHPQESVSNEPDPEAQDTEQLIPINAEELGKMMKEYNSNSTNVSSLAEKAQALLDEIKAFKEVQFGDEFLEQLMAENDRMTEELRNASEALKKRDKEMQKLNETIDKLNESIINFSKNIDKERTAKDEAKTAAYNDRMAKERMEKVLGDTQKKYEQLQDEYDAVRKQLKDAQAAPPRVKVIPMSEMLGLPLMGAKTVKIVSEYLKKYNVIINENK